MGTENRRPYETATALTQELLDQSQDSLVQRLEIIAEIDTPTGVERVSDRAKYVVYPIVGGLFYENRVQFPNIERTLGDFLAGTLENSSLEIVVNNTDKKYSDRLPGGANYEGWIGRKVEMKIGLAELGSSYITVFEGFVTDIGGFARSISSFTLRCRNKFDTVNVEIPNQFLLDSDFPDIEEDLLGTAVPVIYGDWTTELRPEAPSVPAYPVNGLDPLVNGSLDPPDINAGDNPLRLVISSTPLKSLDTSSVTLFRGEEYHTFSAADISIVGGTDNTIFDITQKNLLIDGTPWIYETGDEFFVKCVGVELGGGTYDDNIVEQGRDILIRFGGLSSGDFDTSWNDFRDKNSPAPSDIVNIKSRIWLQERNRVIEVVAALFEQVRLEPYINRVNKWDLNSLHFDEFETNPEFVLKNWDVARDTFIPEIDERNNFNAARADFDFNPPSGENRRSTARFKNQDAVNQAGRLISKLITFPNLYLQSQVEAQLGEILRLTSGYTELAEVTLTSRAFLKDLGNFVQLSIDIGSIEFSASGQPIVGMIRRLSYDPESLGIGAKIWIFQMLNFPGYTGPAGTVGGFDKAITVDE